MKATVHGRRTDYSEGVEGRSVAHHPRRVNKRRKTQHSPTPISMGAALIFVRNPGDSGQARRTLPADSVDAVSAGTQAGRAVIRARVAAVSSTRISLGSRETCS
jgi:hypothetical protein